MSLQVPVGPGVLCLQAVIGAVWPGALTRCCVYSQVMYFSSLFPYVVLICFLVRALLLKGSLDGIRHMFTPKVTQHFYMLIYKLWTPYVEQQGRRGRLGCHGFDPNPATSVILDESPSDLHVRMLWDSPTVAFVCSKMKVENTFFQKKPEHLADLQA